MEQLCIGFKGVNNSSCQFVNRLNSDTLLLTNSYAGLKRDIDAVEKSYSRIFMFGLDKSLNEEIRIEEGAAVDGKLVFTQFRVADLVTILEEENIRYSISEEPGSYLCNEAYYYALCKWNRNAIFIHLPSTRHMSETLSDRLKVMMETIGK